MPRIFRHVIRAKKLNIDYDSIKSQINNLNSDTYYPKLLKRFNDLDTTLTLKDYSLIYYGFSFQKDYLKNKPDESKLKEFLKAKDFENAIKECQKILIKNPASLLANNQMGYSLYKSGKPESEWKKYQKRFKMLRDVIVYSGNGLTCESAFKVIYVSDEYNIIYDYYEIPKIHKHSLVGLCDKFDIDPSDYFKVKTIYFDTSRELIRQEEMLNGK